MSDTPSSAPQTADPATIDATANHTSNVDQAVDTVRLRQLAEQFGVDFVDLEAIELDRELIESFPSQDLFRLSVLPIKRHGQRVQIAVGDPFKLEDLDELTVATGCFLDTVLAPKEQIKRYLNAALGLAGGTVQDMMSRGTETLDLELTPDAEYDDANSSSVGKIVHELLAEAVRQRASDIHIESTDNDITIRYRVDGMLRVQPTPPGLYRFRGAMVSRLKIMARLNIAEKRLPQDGRLNAEIEGRSIDIRASFIPMLECEEVVLRLLDKSRALQDLNSLRLPDEVGRAWKRLIRRPHGLVLVTGPTGSGKTTTLYSSLSEVRSDTSKIITVEDPVEYNLPGISQIQVHNRVGLSFSAGIRSILRHDPDVILIGEIRDAETATSAIQASLTGHLVLSTLHTNDASSALTRLVDMGVEPFLVASTLQGVLAQRLVRRLCKHCREPYRPSATDLLPPDCELPKRRMLHRPQGCSDCNHTGYFGRIAIFELLQVDDQIRKLHNQLDEASIRKTAQQSGLRTLVDSGWEHVLEGETSVEEVLRVCCVYN